MYQSTSNIYRFLLVSLAFSLTAGCENEPRPAGQDADTAGLGQTQGVTVEQPPNIIFILADDLGYGHLGSYGQDRILTPNLDRLAAEGIRFTQAYAGSTVCAPSRSALMTGRHTGHTTMRSNLGPSGERIPLRAEDVTIAEVLKTAGYATGMIGKWGLGEPGTSGLPNKQGFDHWFGFLNQLKAHSYFPTYLWRNDRIVYFNENEQGQRNTYIHDVLVEETLGFIRRHKDERFFLYLPYTLPHLELAAPEDMVAPYRGMFTEKPFPAAHGRPAVTEPTAVFAGMVATLDRDVGRIRALLEELGIDRRTLVIFTSDNGPEQSHGMRYVELDGNGPLRGYKTDLYEGGIRVPFIVWWPGHIERDLTDDESQLAFWDMLPTLAELVGVDVETPVDGISVLPAILGEKSMGQERYLYWEYIHERSGTLLQAVRHGNWKALRHGANRPLELFRLDTDPAEVNNLALHPASIEIIRQMETYLASARTEPVF